MRLAGVMAGGVGNRLRRDGVPHKALARVGDKRLIDHVFGQLVDAGADQVVVATRAEDHDLNDYLKHKRTDWPFELLVSHVPEGAATGAAVHCLMKEIGPRLCLISTVDTVAPTGAYARLFDHAERNHSYTSVLGTNFVSDDQPIWIAVAPDGRHIVDFGKSLAPTGLCFGNVRCFSPDAVATYEEAASTRSLIADTQIMRVLVEAMPNAVDCVIENPIFDVDDREDIRKAEDWLRGQEKAS